MGTTGQSITLANSIIGVGILAMPFCFQQCGVLLATLILLFMGLISRLCCYFLLKSALLARRRNFEFLAFHVFGPAGKMAVELGIIGFLMGTCIAYFVVVGDLGPQIISKMFNINQSDILRTSIMVIVSLVCVLPLGLLRNVDSLSNVSAATIGFYFCLVIKVIAEAASVLPSGAWRRVELWQPRGVLQCVPIFSMALFCQTQLFEIFESLPSLSLEKMNVVTKTAINICTAVYFTLGVFGYIAFCSQDISGNILMSLSPTMASDVIKLGFVMSLAFSFPLIIFPCRASIYSFLYQKVHSSHHDHIINHSIPVATFRCITFGIIAVALFISLLIPNIELVLGLVGSTIGVIICIVFPAACFINVTFKNTNERVLAKGVLILGFFIMVLGTYANLQAAETQIERYDERFITQEKIDKIVEDFFEKRKIGEGQNKAVPINDPALDPNKLNGNIKKDSEVQPPNPVPPESNSNELRSQETNIHKLNVEKSNDEKLTDDLLISESEKLREEAADTISDTHPKNLKNKLIEAKLANEEINNEKKEEKPKTPANDESKVEKIKLIKQQQLIETMKQHGEEQKELMQEQKEILDEIIKNKKEINIENSKPSNEPKVESNNKQEQLIETIKQHGKEQKELMKEQKEILDEIKELKQDTDTNSNEAKKFAVESIKQIADMAIKSIGGVTEKPIGQPEENKNADRLEKLTHEAVQEIAKKAVETIEAIQVIKDKPDVKPANVLNNKVQNNNPMPQNNNLPVIPSEIDTKQNAKIPVGNLNSLDSYKKPAIKQEVVKPEVPLLNLNPQPSNLENIIPKVPLLNLNSQPNKAAIKQTNVKRELQSNVASELEIKNNHAKPDLENPDTKISAPLSENKKVNQNLDKAENNNVAPINTNIGKENLNDIVVKPHSHSPDEPQSYKLGEDSQIKNLDTQLNQNVPLAVAMSDQAKLESTAKNENQNLDIKPIDNIAKVQQNFVNSNNIVKDDIPKIVNVRQKRAAIDCKQEPSERVDKILCKTLNLRPIDNSIDFLPKVDLNDRLSIFPLDIDMLHIGRSLKNYEETEEITISDTHPKNLKNKLIEAKLANEEINYEKNEEKPKPPANDESNFEKIKLIKQQQLIKAMKQYRNKQKELSQEQKEILDEIIKTKKDFNIKHSQPSNEPKVESNNKQQQLIETIKQHGKEQKELMKEQKEILDEIKELKQDKETNSNEAKKFAVESIKQIADMALKSIGGVTNLINGVFAYWSTRRD